MATIKSYTSLEQSRKLAEILPLESADMSYTLEDFVDEETGDVFSIEKVSLGHPSDKEIGCWTLAALLGVLPYGYSSVLIKSFDGKDYYFKLDGEPIETMADNPVDACYELVLKLHELKML